MTLPRIFALALATTIALVSFTTRADVTFPYRQRSYLHRRHGDGAIAHITAGTRDAQSDERSSLPLVIFLHGMNPSEEPHLWMRDGQDDLRAFADALVRRGEVAPFVLAAPSHARFSNGASVMWPDFDVADFVDATARTLETDAGDARGQMVHIDRSRVILIGHSAAGCNTSGGLLGERTVRRAENLAAVVAIDTCVDAQIGQKFALISTRTRLLVYWQPTWQRPMDALHATCTACEIEEIAPTGGNPHDAIVRAAFARALHELLPPSR